MKVKDKGVKKKISRLSEIREEIKELTEEENRIKSFMKEYASENEENTFSFLEDDYKFKCSVYSVKRITYDYEKLKKKLDKSLLKQVTDVKISIDPDDLRGLYKEHPELKEILGSSLVIEKTLNDVRLNELYDDNKITIKDVEGCYSINESYQVRVKREEMDG